jgi:hypothetical protein
VALVAPLQEIDPQVAMQYLQRGMQPPEPTDVYTSIAQYLQQEHYQVERVSLTSDSRIPRTPTRCWCSTVGLRRAAAFEINRAIQRHQRADRRAAAHLRLPTGRAAASRSAAPATNGIESVLGAFGVTVDTRRLLDSSPRQPCPTQNIGGMRLDQRAGAPAGGVKVCESQMNRTRPEQPHLQACSTVGLRPGWIPPIRPPA